MLKRISLLIVSAVLLSLALPLKADVSAASSPMTVTVAQSSAEAGKSFSVDVKFSGVSTPIDSCQFTLHFDPAVLSLSGVTEGTIGTQYSGQSCYEYSIDNTLGLITITYADLSGVGSCDIKSNGVFASIGGKVSSSAVSGKLSAIALSSDKQTVFSDFSLKTIETPSFIQGGVNIVNPALPGDVYVDGKVDIKDLSMMAKYIAQSVQFNAQQILNADCYRDGVISVKDLSILARYMAGYSVTLG